MPLFPSDTALPLKTYRIKLCHNNAVSPVDILGVTGAEEALTPNRASHSKLLMQKMPLILSDNSLPLTTHRCTQNRNDATAPADMQFVTWAPMGPRHNELPIPWVNSPSLWRRTHGPRRQRPVPNC